MKKSIIMASLFAMLQNTNAAEQTQENWWGMEMEGFRPSNSLSIQENSIYLTINDITGLSGTIRADEVSIECGTVDIGCALKKLGLLVIHANKYTLNGEVLPSLPYQKSIDTEEKAKLAFKMAPQPTLGSNKEVIFDLSSMPDFTQQFSRIVEHIKQNFSQLTVLSFKDYKGRLGSRWAFPHPFYITTAPNLPLHKITTMTCYCNKEGKTTTPPWSEIETRSLDVLKKRLRSFIKAHNNYIKYPGAFPNFKYEMTIQNDLYNDYSRFSLEGIDRETKGSQNITYFCYQLNLHIEPPIVPGLVNPDF